ncbi:MULTISPECIES: twin-arginine translocation signal domain-containing protein [unclassified Sphingomonas]|uniref:twin-arginine translocation signal domain-containing protein n=1 Tax=unclassified Sphingomonas TaxID=196159 RepID=UPI00082A3F8D|nr:MULTISPECIES: twin-arginine translocation signal domain-containing protein [unclassified Sphingomonas]
MNKDQSGQVSRRSFLGRAGAISAAGVVAASTVTPALALGGNGVRTYKGKYAIDSHRVIQGFVAGPRGKAYSDIVLVVSENGAIDAAAEATARRYAASGWLAVVPDLPATYDGTAGNKQAMIEALNGDLPRFKRMVRKTGKVAIVAA